MPREQSKGREWEKDRRNRLNKAFTALSKLLPCYDPARTLSKIDILSHSTVYIEELQAKVKDLLNVENAKTKEQLEIKQLTERVKELLKRNDQLCTLLKDANIKIPKEYRPTNAIRNKLRWKDKITQEQAKTLRKKEVQKENETKTVKQKPVKKRVTPLKSQKHQRIFRSKKSKSKKSLNIKQNLPLQIPLLNPIPNRNITLAPGYMITNTPSFNLLNTVTITKTDTSSVVLPDSNNKSTGKSKTLAKSINDKILNTLGPGTLILANGSVVPIMPQPPKILRPPTILTNTAPMIVNQPKTTTTVIVVTTSKTENTNLSTCSFNKTDVSKSNISIDSKSLPLLRPKRCITKTTQVNKVPIPALTSRYSSLIICKQESTKKKTSSSAVTNSGSSSSDAKVTVSSSTSNSGKQKLEAVSKIKPESSSQVKLLSNEGKRKLDENAKASENKRPKVDESPEKISLQNDKMETNTSPISDKEKKTEIIENSKENEKSDNTEDRAEAEKTKTHQNDKNVKEASKETRVDSNNEKGSNICVNKQDNATKVQENTNGEDNLTNVPVSESGSKLLSQINNDQSPTTNTGLQLEKQKNEVVEKNNQTTEKPLETEKLLENINITKDAEKTNTVSSDVDNLKQTENSNKVQEIVGNKDTETSNNRALELGASLYHSELSNDIFSSLQVPLGSQNQESTSPTAAFLLAFPLVSTLTGVKVTEVMDEDNTDSRHGTPTLLQIGTMDSSKTTQTVPSESLTPSLLNLDNFSFFSTKDACAGFYSSFDNLTYTSCQNTVTYSSFSTVSTISSVSANLFSNTVKDYSSFPTISAVSSASTNSVVDTVKDVSQQIKETQSEKISQKEKQSSKEKLVVETEYHVSMKSSASEKPIETSSSICTNPVSNSSTTVVYSTSYNVFPYNAETKCKPKIDVSVKHGANSSSYSQDTFSAVPYANNEVPLLSKQQHLVPSTTVAAVTVSQANVNCNFASEKKFTCSKPQQITYNANPASSMQCNTFNPFADKLPSDYNVNFARTYGNMLYGNNNSNYSHAYNSESNSYMHCYSTKTTAKMNTDVYNQQSYNSNCKNADISKRDNNLIHTSNNNYYRQNGVHHKEKINDQSSKNIKSGNQTQPKPPINWMTTPDLKQDSTFSISTSLGKDFDYTTNNFYTSSSFTRNTHTSCYQAPDFQNNLVDNRKPPDTNFQILPHNSVQRNEFDENQFSWSPTKLPQFFDTSHSFVSSTLPTLVGDLALGTVQPLPLNDQAKIQPDKDLSKAKDNGRRSKSQNYDQSNNQSNFLSVSQLVEKQNEGVPACTTSRRNSGSRSNKNGITHKSSRRAQKPTEAKECGERVARNYNQNKVDMNTGRRDNLKVSGQKNQSLNYVPENTTNWFEYNKNQRQEPKTSQSIYSAEALLGHQISQNNTVFRQQHSNFPVANTKSLPIPNFLSDNIMPYFSSVELQDNNFMQQNQNFQSTALAHNFSNTVQSYSYLSNNHITSASNITSTYLPSSSFISDLNTQDYSTSTQNNLLSQSTAKVFGEKHPPKQNLVVPPTNERPTMQHLTNTDCAVSSVNYSKKAKLKQTTENSLPGLVDFSFLSMPGTIGSPMLPDDFHVHTNFLPPPPTPSQLYSCKNPPYSKQTSDLTSASMITLPPLGASRNQMQNVETPPNMNTIGNSLTNFNLSTIFPEINKVPFQNKPTPSYSIPVPHSKSNT